MARAGLKKVVKTVKGKKRSVRRTYWVKSDPNAGKKKGFLRRHAGKILGAAALVGGAYLAHRAGATSAVRGALTHGREAYKEAMEQRGKSGPRVGLRERASGALAAARHGARQGAGEHYERLRSDAAQGKGGRLTAALAGASLGGVQGARLGVAMHGREKRRDVVHRVADKHYERAAAHAAKAGSGGIMGAYHYARSRISAARGDKARKRARSVE